ncbi:hypothetical protein [Microbacterium algihabitans]|uniref:hypothetical protein n=1 Tax=Microbacterium algihabitans TaxID=3075992 RepID=UPI002905A5E8|nr:hypothetical protein [Microbacterium sp. KSW2-21]
MTVHANALRSRAEVRIARKLNVANLVLAIFFAVGGAVAAFWLWNWAASVWGMPIAWVVIPLCVFLALANALVVGAAFTMIYKPPPPKKPGRAAAAS